MRSSEDRPLVFVSYSHRDRQAFDRLQVHLAPLTRDHSIEVWSDPLIQPGDDWDAKIAQRLESAHAAVMLVSADYLASDYVNRQEIPKIAEGWRSGDLKVYWVLLSPCSSARHPFLGQVQAVIPGMKPLSFDRDGQEAVWSGLADRIVADLAPPPDPYRWIGSSAGPPRKPVPDLLPYRCDRRDQTHQLIEAITSPRPAGPLVCIAHGEDGQGHDEFLRCFTSEDLPTALRLGGGERTAVVKVDLYLPRSDRPDEFGSILQRDLDDELQAKGGAAGGVPVVIEARLSTDDWQGGWRSAVELFLKFWDEWPERSAGHQLLVFLVVTYTLPATRRGLIGWCERIARGRANRRFRRHIGTAAAKRSGRARVLVLEEFRGVGLSHLQTWAKHKKTVEFSGRELLDEVHAVWDRRDPRHAKEVPMGAVAKELKTLLEQVHAGKNWGLSS